MMAVRTIAVRGQKPHCAAVHRRARTEQPHAFTTETAVASRTMIIMNLGVVSIEQQQHRTGTSGGSGCGNAMKGILPLLWERQRTTKNNEGSDDATETPAIIYHGGHSQAAITKIDLFSITWIVVSYPVD